MSILELSTRALRGDAAALSRLIRSLADDFYACRPARLETARVELERALEQHGAGAPGRAHIEMVWELTHVFLSKVPASLRELGELGDDSVESAIVDRIQCDEALGRAELRDQLSLDESSASRALDALERLGILASLPGDALRLTRDGREVKRWIEGRRIAAGAAAQSAPAGPSALRTAGDDLQVLRPREVRELEAKVPVDTEIWVIGVTGPNGDAFFDTVADNLRREVRYYYVCPLADFRLLWSRLTRSFSAEQLRRQLACIVDAPALLRLNASRVHVLPGQRMIRSLRVCWLGAEKPEPFYLALSTPTPLDPNAPLLDSYRRAARSLIERSGDVILDFQRLEDEVRSL